MASFPPFQGVFSTILWKTFQHNSTDKRPRSLGKLPVLPLFLRVKLTIITGILPVFSLSTGFPHPVCGQKAKSSSCMLNAKIPHKIPSCSGHSGCCKPVRHSPQNGAALLPPPPYSITTATGKLRLLHRPIPDEHRVCVVGAIRAACPPAGGCRSCRQGEWAIPAKCAAFGPSGPSPPGWGQTLPPRRVPGLKRPAAPARLYSRRHRLCFGQNAAPGAGRPAQGPRHKPPAARG